MPTIFPSHKVPDLDLPLVNSERWKLSENLGAFMTALVFYRGLHCPVCKMHVLDFQFKSEAFTKMGVTIAAISTDSLEKAQ